MVIPHGIYDVGLNRGFVHLNTSHDTSELACDSIAAWWEDLLIDNGVTDFGVQRVDASTSVVNAATRRVIVTAGLRFVRIFHQDWPDKIEGDEEGDVEYALLRSEWERRAD